MKVFYFLIAAFLVCSCNYKPYSIDYDQNVNVVYNKNSLLKFQTKGVLSNTQIIPLYGDSLVFSPKLLMLCDSIFYIIADKQYNKVYAFDSNFRFIRFIGNTKDSLKGFSSINSVNLDSQNNIHVFSNDYTESIYSMYGDFIAQNDLSYIYSSAFGNSIDYFYYLTNLNVYFDDRVLITDYDGADVGKYFPEDYKVPVVEELFPVFIGSPSNDAVYVRRTMTNKVHKFLNDTMFCAYSFDFGEFAIPQSVSNTDDDFGGIQKQPNNYFATLVRFFKGSNVAILAASVQKPDGPSIAYGVNNKGVWKWLNYPFPQNLSDPLSGSLQGVNVNDELIFLLSSEQLLRLMDDTSFKFNNATIMEVDSVRICNYFILKCKLK